MGDNGQISWFKWWGISGKIFPKTHCQKISMPFAKVIPLQSHLLGKQREVESLKSEDKGRLGEG